jgi:Fe2+ or Zn2+ uptake regulation protein
VRDSPAPAILRAFRAAGDEHRSADEVLRRASAEVPDIGRGTVYATLAELTELGLLLSVGQPEPVRYELNTDGPYDHFRCRLCCWLTDIRLDAAEPSIRRWRATGWRASRSGLRASARTAWNTSRV